MSSIGMSISFGYPNPALCWCDTCIKRTEHKIASTSAGDSYKCEKCGSSKSLYMGYHSIITGEVKETDHA
jgi:Zn finger protein HypA/HybF involved in hydrogenase expression